MRKPIPALLLAITCLALAACSAKEEAPTAAVIRPVLVQVAHPNVSETAGPFVGAIAPRYETPLSFQLPGRIIARSVGVGDIVTKGQLLASLDATIQQFQLVTAEANLANARSQFNNIAAAEERARSLAESGTASQSQLDAAVTARQTADAQLSQAQASLDRARDQLGYTQISAGYDGVVISVGAEVGQVVGAGQTIVTLARPDIREAVFDAPESLVSKLQPGSELAITVPGNDSLTAKGNVREIAPIVSGSTRSQRVRISIDNPPDAFRIGTLVHIAYQFSVPPSFILPASALLERDGKSFVWLADPASSTVATHEVALAGKTTDTISIGDGLAEGNIVVVAGVNSLTNGQAVTLPSEERR